MTSVIEAIALIDSVLGVPTPDQAKQEQRRLHHDQLAALGLSPHAMGGISTRGCPRCRGTMYRTRDKGGSQWVCSNNKCGHVE